MFSHKKDFSQLYDDEAPKRLVKVECVNGHKLLRLVELFPNFNFVGLDYSVEMIQAAKSLNNKHFN